MDALKGLALPSAATISSQVTAAAVRRSSPGRSMSFTTTEAPRAASSRAYDRPSPPPAPVTIATLPSKRNSVPKEPTEPPSNRVTLTAPAPATRNVLKKAGMSLSDIDLFEVNEAFASVVLRFLNETGADPDKVNVNGGAMALGHPIGATGPILLATLLDELERRDLSTGVVTMCTGGGMGTATVIERV